MTSQMSSAPCLIGRGQLSVVERLADPVMDIDPDGKVAYANRAACDALQLSVDEIVGRPVEDFVAPEDPVALMGIRDTVGEGVSDAQLIFCAADGTQQLYHFNATVDDMGHIALCARNGARTQQEFSEVTRWAASEQERTLVERKARKEVAQRNAELRKMQLELRHAFDQLKAEVEKRELLEQELRLAQKLESIGQLAAGVAHEINTPMQYIGDNLQFLSRAFDRLQQLGGAYREVVQEGGQGDQVEKVKRAEKKARLAFLQQNVPPAFEQAIQGVKRVSEIVQAMKAFSRADSADREAIDVNKLIRDTLIVARSEYKELAEVHYDDVAGLPPFHGYAGQLSQVILNLVVNAAHAIADQKRGAMGNITLSVCAGEEALEIEVRDDGPGIPEEIRHRVFDPFFTTKVVGRGTGQGLSLARRIVVEKHGGSLDMESTAGEGTVFRMVLPMSTDTE